jgi:hydrogenase maturation protease
VIRIIGIGSPFGDDDAGLEAARRLAAAPPPETDVVAADRPGAALIDLFDGADAVILIDAARSGAPAGTIHDLDLHALPADASGLVSSHGLGVAAVVRLAATLARLPPRGRVLAIEAAATSAPQSAGLSAAAQGGVLQALKRARWWCGVYESRRGKGDAARFSISE